MGRQERHPTDLASTRPRTSKPPAEPAVGTTLQGAQSHFHIADALLQTRGFVTAHTMPSSGRDTQKRRIV